MKFICIKCGQSASAGKIEDVIRVGKTCYDCRQYRRPQDGTWQKQIVEKPCKECGQDYLGTRKSMYCSNVCRQIGKKKTINKG